MINIIENLNGLFFTMRGDTKTQGILKSSHLLHEKLEWVEPD